MKRFGFKPTRMPLSNFLRPLLLLCFLLLGISPDKKQSPRAELKNVQPVPDSDVDFRNPIGLPIDLAGNFGEIRTAHFHAGIDIRTEGQEGWPLVAVEEGAVSRIKVKPSGYGRTLYIDHPNGYTSVYAHLQKFNDELQQFVRKVQYERESFYVDIYPNKDKFKFNKGDTVAFSGNSGSSRGPHLHFELRESATQTPVNPLKHGYHVTDKKPPLVNGVGIYTMVADEKTNTFQKAEDKFFYTRKRDGHYSVAYKQPLQVCRHFGVGLSTTDLLHKYGRSIAVYSIKLFFDDSLVYEHKMDRFSFSETRYVNAHIDYASELRRNAEYQQCFIWPGNKLSIYETRKGQGIITLEDDSVHEVKAFVTDAAGNTSRLRFNVQLHDRCSPDIDMREGYDTIFYHDKVNRFKGPGFRLQMPRGALYNNIYFHYEREVASRPGIYSGKHVIHDPQVPVHRYYTVKIKPKGIPKKLRSKALIARVYYNDYLEAHGGSWEGDYLKAKVREFGDFVVTLDTVPPHIRLLNIYNGKNMKWRKSIRVAITDNLSGIDEYRGTIDGKWVLMQYDKKYDLLEYEFEDRIGPGEHTFRLVVTDDQGNQSSVKVKFKR